MVLIEKTAIKINAKWVNFEEMKKASKKLSPRDVVLGIGRKATDEELAEYLNRPRKEKFKPLAQVRKEITAHLRK